CAETQDGEIVAKPGTALAHDFLRPQLGLSIARARRAWGGFADRAAGPVPIDTGQRARKNKAPPRQSRAEPVQEMARSLVIDGKIGLRIFGPSAGGEMINHVERRNRWRSAGQPPQVGGAKEHIQS